MQYKDLLRGTVLLIGVEATALGAISAIAIHSSGEESVATFAIGFWLLSFLAGILLGQRPRAVASLAGPLAAAILGGHESSSRPRRRVGEGRSNPV